MPAKDMKLTISDPSIPEDPQSGARKKTFLIGLVIIAVFAIAAIVWVAWGLRGKEAEFEVNLKKRLDLMAASQVQVMNALVETAVEQANRVINSELYKLYAAEVHLIEDDVALLVSGPLPGQENFSDDLAQLSAQLPMMESLLVEFTRISGYLGGRVVNRNGTVFIATDAATTPLRVDQMEMVRQVLQLQRPQFGPLVHSDQGLILEVFLPIFPPEASGLEQTPVAVLLLTRVTGERLSSMTNNRLLEKGERIRFLQKAGSEYQEVVPTQADQLQNIKNPPVFDDSGQLPFAIRSSLAGQKKVYSSGTSVSGPDWKILVEADYDISREQLRGQEKTLISIAALLVLVFTVAFGALWAAFIGYQERKAARHFESLAEEIEQQRQLLDRINNTISDYIVLKDLRGHYLYVNPAFADAVGRSSEEMIGLDSEAIFGYDTARRLENSDQQVLASGKTVTLNEQVYLQSKLYHLQISKSAIKDTDGKPSGVVSVIRDVTAIVDVQRRQEQATAKTVEALVRAIELTDPYLAGHSRLMRSLSVEVAKAMNASDIDIATVDTAANLSQVGKLFLDRELLFKAETLTAEEKFELEQHTEHAAKVLQDIDFGLPVFDAVYQMNEMLNGKGYPNGLQGDEIGLPARILAVVNSFCAMVEPRAYRAARSSGEVLEIIKSGDGAYDQRVVAALKEVVQSAIGEKLLDKHSQH
jgi:PAS domain S-box-containing protein